ncbi:MAG: tryptophan--tRNA ligase [Candidatus Saccharimonas sp.]
MEKPVILTGIRANNNIHIGNYFGAMLPIINMAKKHADEYNINLFIPDLHSFTTPIDHAQLYENIINNARMFAAAGLPLDHPSIYVYRQSFIPAHSELTWILDCFTSFGEMSRMTQFKDKSSKLGDAQVSVGLFNYPVLMAADILLYNALYISVGDDQTQHLEITRDIAQRMNHRFGDIFTVPVATRDQHTFFGKEQGLRIRDLIDPRKKMSKSDDTGKGVIFLSDTPDAAAKKIMGATTDDLAQIHYDRESQPGITNLMDILLLMRQANDKETSRQQIIHEFEGQTRYGDFKRVVADETATFLATFQHRLATVDDNAIFSKLESSEQAMNKIANETLLRTQKAVGLRK